MIQVAMKKFI